MADGGRGGWLINRLSDSALSARGMNVGSPPQYRASGNCGQWHYATRPSLLIVTVSSRDHTHTHTHYVPLRPPTDPGIPFATCVRAWAPPLPWTHVVYIYICIYEQTQVDISAWGVNIGYSKNTWTHTRVHGHTHTHARSMLWSFSSRSPFSLKELIFLRGYPPLPSSFSPWLPNIQCVSLNQSQPTQRALGQAWKSPEQVGQGSQWGGGGWGTHMSLAAGN